VIVHVVNIGGIVNNHCLEAIVHVVDIDGIVDHYAVMVNNSTNINNMNNHL
jgi:L-fucose mutarotase/ribose pyranase (RbsD/FucU family)